MTSPGSAPGLPLSGDALVNALIYYITYILKHFQRVRDTCSGILATSVQV